jgi:hypothetical protein
VSRLSWTIGSNLLLLGAAFKAMRRADTVLFTGSPPLMVHFIAPLNLLLGKQLIYRITDFHPECLIAERGRSGPVLALLLSLTQSGLQKATGSEHSRRYRSTYSCFIRDEKSWLKRLSASRPSCGEWVYFQQLMA